MEKHFLYTEIDLYWSPQLRTWPCSPSGTVPFLPCCHTRLDVPAHNRNLPGPLQCQEASLGFLLYSCSATGFYQQWYPSLGFYLPHKFKVSFNSRCGACRHSYSGTEDNKSNKCSVLSPFYLDLALPAPLKPGAVGTLCWCLHCSRGGKKRRGKQGKEVLSNPKEWPERAQLHAEFQQLGSRAIKHLGCTNPWLFLTHKRGFYQRAAPDAKEMER